MSFCYYKGDWTNGKILVLVIQAESLTLADIEFEAKTGINPLKNNSISVTLQPLEIKHVSIDHSRCPK